METEGRIKNEGKPNKSNILSFLTSNTVYYFRPYAKYADGTKTNGGTSTASYTKSN